MKSTIALILPGALIACTAVREPETVAQETFRIEYDTGGTAPLLASVSVRSDGCIELRNIRQREITRCLSTEENSAFQKEIMSRDVRGAVRSISELRHEDRFADYESLRLALGKIEAYFVFDELPPQVQAGPVADLLRDLDLHLTNNFGRNYDFNLLPPTP